MLVSARFQSSQLWFVGALAISGCAYQPGSFSHASPSVKGVEVTVDCLDIALDHEDYPRATSNVVAYSFANRCDDPVVVDLAAARVYGTTRDGTAVDLQAFD